MWFNGRIVTFQAMRFPKIQPHLVYLKKGALRPKPKAKEAAKRKIVVQGASTEVP